MARRIRSLLPALTLVFALVAGAVPALAQPAPAGAPLVFAPHGVTTDRFPAATTPQRVDVTAHDGVNLHARVFRPDTSSDPSWKTPVILVHSPYYDGVVLGSPSRSMDLVERFTPKGYTVVLSDVRGTGNSGGCGEQDGANQAKDFATLVEHFAAQPWSSGKVGSYGKSYDAETQNAGAVLQPDGLATMVTVAGISALYDVAYFDGVPLVAGGLGGAAAYELYDLDVPSGPEYYDRRAQRHTCQPDNFVNGADPRGDMSPYWAARDFRPGVGNVEASVLYVHGLSDFTVSPIAIDGWYDELPTFKRAILGQWGHYYPYDAPAATARDDWYDAVHAWFDQELLGLDTDVASWPAVQVQDESNVWRAVPSAAGMGTEVPLSLGDGTLGTPGGEEATATWTEGGSVAFDGPVLDDGLHLSGQAYLDAVIAVDRDDAHFAVTLQEVRADGTTRTLTRGYLSAQHRESLLRAVPATPGHPTPYRIRTYPFDKTLAPGSRLRLLLAGSDGSTLPAGNRYTATVSVDGASVLRVPVVMRECGLLVAQREPAGRDVPGCPGGVPAAAPRHVPPASGGHVATARIVATASGTIGQTQVVRESGYLTVRDGVELAFEVIRPDDGKRHPTLFTYDGYDAGDDPDPGYANRYVPRGYALLGVNLRGTGCSGGIFDFFQPAEGRDGYEVVEWAAAQPWATGHVGMIGKSYPGITQLFVAEQRPPHLRAITPGHYFADAYRDVAFPGGILNYAFASLWSFISQPESGTQAGAAKTLAGDQTCARHQRHHADNARTNPFVQAQEHPHDDPLLRERSPLTNVDRIQVPVYQALSWQDEQLWSRQSHLLTEFTRRGIPFRAVLSNGDHGMYRKGPQLAEMDRFLEAHVERRQMLRDGTPRARYLAEPPVTVFWEQGAQGPRWRTTLDGWGEQAKPLRLYTGPDGTLRHGPPDTVTTSDAYVHSPASSQGIANPSYALIPHDDYLWDNYSPPENAALAYTSEPFTATTTLLGSASADLWLTATAPNVDLQVTLTEVRPDGQEVFVQQGWLRADQRALDDRRSSALLPVQTHRVADVQPLSPTEPALARVEIFPFGHVLREGSRLRMWVEAPTVVPQLWGFAIDPTPAHVNVFRDTAHPSSLVLPVAEVAVPADAVQAAPCGSVIRQPCRQDPRG